MENIQGTAKDEHKYGNENQLNTTTKASFK